MNQHPHSSCRFMVVLFALVAISVIIGCQPKSSTSQEPAQHALPQPFGTQTARYDALTRAYLSPTRVMWVSNADCFGDTDVLLQPGTGQAEVGARATCTMTTTATDTASILLDFGRELHGGIQIVINSAGDSPVPMRIRLGESVGETFSDCQQALNDGYSFNDHAVRDFVIDVARYGKMEYGSSGFRFARIDLLAPVTICLKEVNAVMRYRDIPYVGSFHCSDTRLDSIWMTAAYTVHLNMQEYVWDGVKRDRLIWLGDLHPEVNTIMSVFGQNDAVPASIDLACEQYPQPQWFNGMSSYSMWYLIIQHDWYMRGGDLDYVRQHHDYIRGVIDHIYSCVDEQGNENLGGGRFLDWPSSPNTEGVESGYRALLVWSMRDAAKLCRLLDDEESAQRCEEVITRLSRLVKPHHNLKQAAALMAIAGLMPAEEACQECILPGGPKGFSTFYGYYMLEALAMAGHYDEAMDVISQYWGGMLDLGATTFWEDFNLDWTTNAGRIDDFTPEGKDDIHGDFGAYCYPSYRHSFCHGWASGPAPWLTRHVLGIEVVEPGCRTLKVTPHLGHLDWAEGTYPTPHGIVTVCAEKQADGSLKTSVKAPRGVKIIK